MWSRSPASCCSRLRARHPSGTGATHARTGRCHRRPAAPAVDRPAGGSSVPRASEHVRLLGRRVRTEAHAFRRRNRRLDPGLARAGIELLRGLPATSQHTVLLCTDLHPENVLAAGREPWLMVDPKPYVGDPTYDPVQHMLNFPTASALIPPASCSAWPVSSTSAPNGCASGSSPAAAPRRQGQRSRSGGSRRLRPGSLHNGQRSRR